jgi:hypothetical protein
MGKTVYNIISFVLAISLGGGAISPLYPDCISRRTGQRVCEHNHDRMAAETYAAADILVKEIKRVPCQMNRVYTFVAPERARRKIERPSAGAYVVQVHENSLLTAYVRGHARRMSTPLRAAPERLYLQNLVLLI